MTKRQNNRRTDNTMTTRQKYQEDRQYNDQKTKNIRRTDNTMTKRQNNRRTDNTMTKRQK
jgi:hypothetical protein